MEYNLSKVKVLFEYPWSLGINGGIVNTNVVEIPRPFQKDPPPFKIDLKKFLNL